MIGKQTPLYGKFFRGVLCGVALLMTAAGVAAQTATFTAQNYPLFGNRHIAADFNRDGKLDLAGSGATSAAVMINNGDGTFRPTVNYPVGGYADDVAAGDFDGDGLLDLAVTIHTAEISLSLLKGNGDGTFGAPTNFPNTTGYDSPSVVADDFNNDGRLDLVIAHSMGCYTGPCVVARTISVMFGNGDGTFQPTREVEVGPGMSRAAVGDFNRDGLKDLAIGGGGNAQLYILLGTGGGSFAQQPTMGLVEDTLSPTTDVDVADVNGDTVQDVVVSTNLNACVTAVVLGNGDGTFRAPTLITQPNVMVPQYAAVADYNGDGKQDLAISVANSTTILMEMSYGNGDGTFQPVTAALAPPPQSSLGGGPSIAADFNGDGKPDIALGLYGSNPFFIILINTTGATTPPPASLTVSSLTLNPSSVTGGGTSTGTVTLSARAQTATVVRLSSSNASAAVPSSVTVAAGASSASFNVTTSQVSTATTATLTASLNATSRSATLTINPAATTTADTVAITRAEYDSSKRVLRVEATSTRSTATLKAYVTSTGALIGTLTNNGGGKYGGQFNLSTNPQSITVRSSLGGQATRTVTAK